MLTNTNYVKMNLCKGVYEASYYDKCPGDTLTGHTSCTANTTTCWFLSLPLVQHSFDCSSFTCFFFKSISTSVAGLS